MCIHDDKHTADAKGYGEAYTYVLFLTFGNTFMAILNKELV